MLDFEFTNEQNLIRKSVGELCRTEIEPQVRNIDEARRIPNDLIRTMAEIGLLGMTASEEYGGTEADAITVGVVGEELARADISCAIPTFFLVQAAWGYILNKYGSDAAKETILPRVTKGRAFLGIAATEPDVGSDLANMKTVAVKSADKYVVNGEKMFISGIDETGNQLAEGGGYLTLARTDTAKGTRGMSLLYIPIKNAKGITTTVLEDWGRKGISTGGFAAEDAEVPEAYLLGDENRGFYIAMEGFDFARAVISVVCCGAAMSALEKAMEHLKLRTAFGQPIGRYEGIQFKLAEHWAKLDAVRLLGYRALWMYAKNQKEGAYGRYATTKACAEAKMLAPAFAFEAINDAIQWFGAFGYTTDCPLELALRGVRSYFWAEGTLEIMKIIVSRELLGRDYVAHR